MRAKYPDIDASPRAPSVQDDRYLDRVIRGTYAQAGVTPIVDGRTIGPVWEGLVRRFKLDPENCLLVHTVCPPSVRAERGLVKYRRVTENPGLTVDEVEALQARRDRGDWSLFRQIYPSYRTLEEMFEPRNPKVRHLELHTDTLLPLEGLLVVLLAVKSMGKLEQGGLVMGMCKAIYHSQIGRLR